MKIYPVIPQFISFDGQRKDRRNVEQLKKNNPYDLNVINQRQIEESINNLAETGGEKNADFLINVSKNLKYGTNIDLGKTPNHDWQAKLYSAAKIAAEKSPEKARPKLYAKMDKIASAPKPLTTGEREILELRKSILDKVDRKALNNIANENIGNFDSNFDYLISSSEMTTAQKLYILKRLNYMMSPKYKINKMLADKKTRVLAEMVNDMVINTPEAKIPNIKSVNQLTTGTCAAISICRKNLAYEDKANYVDMIMSELDDKDEMMIYDISQLGSGKKIPVAKPYIDYDYAMKKGFRIIDASVLNWMNVADMTGRTNAETGNYVAFDKEYFDTFSDIHLISDINEELSPEQDYYRALLKAKSAIKECKKSAVMQQIKTKNRRKEPSDNIKTNARYSKLLMKKLAVLSPEASRENIRRVLRDLCALETAVSASIDKCKDYKKPYMYIPNEPEKNKIKKIKAFLADNLTNGTQISDNDAADIMDLTESLNKLNSGSKSSAEARRVIGAKKLYKAAAAYRVQTDFGLENDYRVCDMMKTLNLPDRESLIIQNMEDIISKIDKGTLSPAVKAVLLERFGADSTDDEALKIVIETNMQAFREMMSTTFDSLYRACTLPGRKQVLLQKLETIRDSIIDNGSKTALEELAYDMNMPADKRKICNILEQYIETLSAENPSEKDYLEIYNKTGGKNQMLDFKDIIENLGKVITENTERAAKVRRELNTANGLPADAPVEQTLEVYKKLADDFNQISTITSTFQGILEVRDIDGKILNTVIPKELIMKKLEDDKLIISTDDLKAFQNKFLKIEGALNNPDGTRNKYKDLPKELTTFTKHEKEVLELIKQNINGWYSITLRNLDAQYKDIEEPLNEHYRKLGVITGWHWLADEGQSGLSRNQQVKILESMTDRPYYVEENGKKALDKILDSPYSGISSMSMASNEQAMHAQYIVDIKPITVKTKDGETTKYAIFHDNSWGPAEHENVWIGEGGLIRTDYGQEAGGEHGFITGKNYRNGQFLDELLGKTGENKVKRINNKQYKKLERSRESYKFPMLSDIITPGISPKARSIVTSLKTNTMYPAEHLEELKKYASEMTRDEMEQKFKKFDLLGANYESEYQRIEDRILGNGQFDKGIETKEAYDKLSSGDNLKLLLEASAVLNSYYAIPDKKQFYIGNFSVKKNENMKTVIRKEARDNFLYSLGKLPEIAEAGKVNSANEIYNLLTEYQKETCEKFTQAQIKKMIFSLSKIDKSKFNGSMSRTIDLMTDSFRNSFDLVPDAKTYEKRIQLINNVRTILAKNMYLNINDLKSSEFKRDNLPYVEKWIDDTFDPESDKDFVKIYNSLTDMPADKFREKYNYLLTDEAMGIKPITGYDMLKKYRAMDENVQNSVSNLYFCKEYYNTIDETPTTPYYTYTKLSRVLNGGKYGKVKKSFDDIYLDYSYALRSLTAEKGYGRIKHAVYKKYGLFPAYAKVETEDPQGIEQSLDALRLNITDYIDTANSIKNILGVIRDTKDFKKRLVKYDNNSALSEEDYADIMHFAAAFHNEYKEDYSIPDAVNASEKMLMMPPETKAKDFKKAVNTVYKEFAPLETLKDGRPISDEIKQNAKKIKEEKQSFVTEAVEPRYREKAYELLNKWTRAKSKKLPDADKYFAEFEMFYDKHRITLSPQKLLRNYLMLLAKPTKDNDPYKTMSESQKSDIENIKKTYERDIASLLYSAKLVELQNILMRAAKDGSLNMVKQELKNTKIMLQNGKVINLCSKDGLNIMLKDLIDENDVETAVMFIDQLGLSELAVETFSKYINFDNARKILKRSYNIFDSVDKQYKTVEEECEKLKDIDNDPNWKERVEQTRADIKKACGNTSFKNSGKIIDSALTQIIAGMGKNRNVSKYKLLTDNMQYAKSCSIELARKNVDALNESLEKIQTVSDLLHAIKLPPKSGCEKYIEEFDKNVEDLESFSLQLSHYFKHIGISVGNANSEPMPSGLPQ